MAEPCKETKLTSYFQPHEERYNAEIMLKLVKLRFQIMH